MKLYTCLLLLVYQFFIVISVIEDEDEDENSNDFSVVTAFRGLTSLYLRMKIRELHLEPNPEVDTATKERICRSITRGGYFATQYKEYPVNMNAARHNLSIRAQSEMEDFGPNAFLERILQQDYVEDEGNSTFTYRTSLTLFSTDYGDREEFAFACISKNRADGSLNIYYVSEPYNINLALDVPNTDHPRIGACFVCLVIISRCRLVALAEEPAKAVVNLNIVLSDDLADIYRQMRNFHEVAQVAADDPLCGLNKSEKLRICASVLGAAYFDSKIKKFNPDLELFEGECRFEEVSLEPAGEIQFAVIRDKRRTHKEWMLSCRAELIHSRAETTYSVSRAYHSHYAFVYSRSFLSKNWCLECIVANVSVIVERKDERIHEEQSSAPKLVDLLYKSTKSTSDIFG